MAEGIVDHIAHRPTEGHWANRCLHGGELQLQLVLGVAGDGFRQPLIQGAVQWLFPVSGTGKHQELIGDAFQGLQILSFIHI